VMSKKTFIPRSSRLFYWLMVLPPLFDLCSSNERSTPVQTPWGSVHQIASFDDVLPVQGQVKRAFEGCDFVIGCSFRFDG
jgi:hypothetical protein